MKSLPRFIRVLLRVLVAVAAIAVSSVIFVALREVLSISVVALLYLLAVVLCTRVGGLPAGVAASILAFFAFNYFFLAPYGALTVHQSQDIIALFVFLTVAIIVSNLMGRAQIRLEQVQAREQAERRAKVLEESDRLKTAILSSVSHDLRTPLASIQASASTLFGSETVLEAEARKELQSILLEETEHLNQLVGNLLNMSRIEAGALKLQKQWNSISELIGGATERMQRQLTRHTLEIDAPDDLPLVQVDAVLIEQVFVNLLSNSAKYAPAGSCIAIRATATGPETMLVTVTNQGPKISAEYLGRLFDKFFLVPGMKQEGSTGLGLSICQGIVEAHGGRIWAENVVDGLAFHFTLPIDKSEILIPAEDDPHEQ